MITIIDVEDIVNQQLGSKELIPYLIKLQLLEKQFKIDINYQNIKDQVFEDSLCYYKLSDRYYIVFQE